MASALTEEVSSSLQRGLSEWWNEETDYIFQRIERWAAIARGYNRLRSQRLSRGRLTMHEEQETRWSITSNKIVIEDPNWCPRFHNLRRSHRRKNRYDESCRINCCGTLDYQSAGKVDSQCLENYRYDHSIYFKTIGDIKSSKREESAIDDSFYEDDSIFLEVNNHSDPFADRSIDDDEENAEKSDAIADFSSRKSVTKSVIERERAARNVWPIVDLKKLNIDTDHDDDRSICERKIVIDDRKSSIDHFQINSDDINNNNNNNNSNDGNNNDDDNDSTEKMIKLQIAELSTKLDSTIESSIVNSTNRQKNMETTRKSRSPRKIQQSVVTDDIDILWSDVLLNYTNDLTGVDNVDLSPHHYRPVEVK